MFFILINKIKLKIEEISQNDNGAYRYHAPYVIIPTQSFLLNKWDAGNELQPFSFLFIHSFQFLADFSISANDCSCHASRFDAPLSLIYWPATSHVDSPTPLGIANLLLLWSDFLFVSRESDRKPTLRSLAFSKDFSAFVEVSGLPENVFLNLDWS